ncbi:MAG: molybdopterin-dependent oxidoreductase [Dehalococcoidia bacterium]
MAQGKGQWVRLVGTGVVVGVLWALLLLVARFALGVPSLQEVVAERLVKATPGWLFGFLLDRLLYLAKPLLLGGLSLGLAAVATGTVVGMRQVVGGPSLWPWAVWVGSVLGLVGVGLGWLAGGGGFPFWAGISGASAVAGLATAALESATAPTPSRPDRRAALGRLALWGMVGVGALWGIRLLVGGAPRLAPPRQQRRPPGSLPPDITPTEQFYIVSKNFVDPQLDAGQWTLQVDGLVGAPFTLTYQDLLALPAVELPVTLQCISNPVGGDLISTAIWKGVPLKRLLEQARLQEGVRKVALFAADGYSDSLPLDVAIQEQVLVAYAMNGEPLPYKHGFPARLLVPGRYGLKSVKWLTRIRPVAEDFKGFWQEQGWSDTAFVHTTSQVWTPRSGQWVRPGQVEAWGIAFAGDRGISRVEVSWDEGQTWEPALLRPALSPYTWHIWTTQKPLDTPGRHTLRVRAADGAGQWQATAERDPFPDGALGIHSVILVVTKEDGSI